MKKFLALAMAAMMVASLAACNGNVDETTPSEEETNGGNEVATLSGTLKVAALESAYGKEAWENVVNAFKAHYPDLTVELTVDPQIETIESPLMQAGDYPDVFHLATGRPDGLTEDMISENMLRDLSTMLATKIPGEEVTPADKIIDGFTDTAVTNPYSDGKTYLAPMFYSPCGLWYSADLFAEKGWEVPKTWDEMWALGDKAKAEGIYLFTYPTAGYFDAFLTAMIYSQGGADLYNKAMKYEGWDTDEMKTVLETVAKLADYTEPSTVANATNTGFTQNQQLVIDHKALFMPNGTWIIGEMEASTPDTYKWGFTPVPAVNTANAPVSFCWLEQMWSPKDAANPEAADAFMAFCYSDEAADIFAAAGAIQPVTGVADKLEGDSKLFYSVYDNGASAVMGGFAATEPVDGVDIGATVYQNMDKIVGGTLTVDDWQKEIVDVCGQLKDKML